MKTEVKKQMQTERGLIYVEATYSDKAQAKTDGFDYAFTSSALGCDVYSKCLDDRGLRHSFILIK